MYKSSMQVWQLTSKQSLLLFSSFFLLELSVSHTVPANKGPLLCLFHLPPVCSINSIFVLVWFLLKT